MYHTNLAGVCILFVTAICVRSSAFRGSFRPPRYDVPARNCDAENKNALDLIKSEILKLQQVVVGLRQKLDPDFKYPPPQNELVNCAILPEVVAKSKSCPPGFQYVQRALSCYKIVNERLNWIAAGQRCQELHPEAHLAAITKSEENIGLKAFLDSEIANITLWRKPLDRNFFRMYSEYTTLWTSGQRLNETSCTDEFVWKMANSTELPLSFTYWERNEPNCHGVGNKPEGCLEIRPQHYSFEWNDVPCDMEIFPLCEYDPL